MHLELCDYSFKYSEGQTLRLPEGQEQKSSNEVHSLTIVQSLLVHYSVSLEDVI